MSKTQIPVGYRSALNVHDTQIAIGKIKSIFNDRLCAALNLSRVSAPLFVGASTGFNDDLNGIERAVAFDIKETGTMAQVVHSLAKWKRYALYKYGFSVGEGVVTDMNAIRRDEEMDNLHSIYVDQWDWEKVISREQRNVQTLKDTVSAIVGVVCDTLDEIKKLYPAIDVELSRDVKFVTTYELEEKYPSLTAKERENAAAEEYGTVFLMQIGDKLKSGEKHDGRAPDYDDWSLNGDILFYNKVLGCAFEISSMGIRVDKEALLSQLEKAGCPERRELMFHRLLLNGTLPLTMGGGIGQSRICMLLLGKAHVGEVQASIWDDQTVKLCREAGVELL
ncbi:MAG TPA: aspartate--ammonia ligase [Ruminococcaceae bacterium]|nr:aspartate--ammonia ligase [Oscillospiraceae bacterium]